MEVNYDILSLVSQLLAQLHRFKDVSSMAQTCRLLNVECASLLLTPRHLRVFGDEGIGSFCLFMLADKRGRFPLLSQCIGLKILAPDPLSEPVVDLLIEALGHVTTLPYIRFLGFEHLMDSSPRILPALAAITWFYHLEIDSFNFTMLGKRFYAKFLKTLQAPGLNGVKLLLPLNGWSHRHISYNRELDPLWLFSSFSSTLEIIIVLGTVTVNPSSATHVYPRLTRLTVPKHAMALVRPYISAFPSLRILRFDYSEYRWAIDALPTHSLFTHTLRNKSCEDLRKHNREDQIVHGSWTALEYFMGMTLDAYMAGLTCRIPNLHLIAWGGTKDAEIEAICAMYTDARPSVFRLALRPAHVDYLPALFYERVELFSSMSSLELRLDVAAVPFDFKAYLDTVGTSLQRLPTVTLQVEIKCLAHIATVKPGPRYCDDGLDSEDTAEERCYTIDGMAGEDVQARLRSFMKQVPTLRRATIAWGRCRREVPHRLVTIDLDNIPHSTDRPGRRTDQYWRDGYENRN